MINNEELNAFKEELEALNKKLAELSEDKLKEVAGGNKTEQGAWIESGQCFKYGNNLYIYEGPTAFVPVSENIPLDWYKPCTSEDGTVYYQFYDSVSKKVSDLAYLFTDLGNKSTLPYELRRRKK